jgi:SAM-dependent methyltransferase
MALGKNIVPPSDWDRPGDRPPGHYLHLLWVALREELGSLEGRVVDIGCGLQPYRTLLGPKVTEHVGVDRAGRLTAPDIEGDALNLPLPDASFDVAISTQVLEHVPQPWRAVAEMARVLRPGGRVVVTCPGTWPHHEEPHDFYRYTRFGLEELFREHFDAVTIRALGGMWSSIGMMVNLEIADSRIGRKLVPWINRLAVNMEARGSKHEMALNWLLTARRKG